MTLILCTVINLIISIDHVCSAVIFALSLYGRHFARKNLQPCGLFTMNIVAVPIFYFMAFKYKHVDQIMTSYRPRPTFNECLEFYPVTRRAWKRAMIIREKEMQEIKSKVGNLEQVSI
jgi:hypothetical protein